MTLRCLIATLAVTVLSGCVSAPKLTDHQSRLQAASEFNFILVQDQLELIDANTNPGAFGGGLLGVMLSEITNDVKQNRAESALDVLREQLAEYDLRQEITDHLSENMDQQALPRHLPLTLINATEERMSSAANVVDLTFEYRLSNKLDRLYVALRLNIYDANFKPLPSGAPRTKYEPHYWATYLYVLSAPEAKRVAGTSRRDEFEQAWLDRGVDQLHADILQGVEDVVDLMNMDLNTASNPAVTDRTVKFVNYYEYPTKAKVIRELDDRVWAHDKNNNYYSVRRNAIDKLN